MIKDKNKLSALLVADAPGHLLERIGEAWVKHSESAYHELVCSHTVHAYNCVRAGSRIGLIHWIDARTFLDCAFAVTVPQVVMVHHIVDSEIDRYKKKLKYCDGITTSSILWKHRLEKITAHEIDLIPYTINTEIFKPGKKSYELRKKYQINDNEFIIGFVGKGQANLDDRKGIALFLKIIRDLKKLIINFSIVLVGPGWEELAAQITELGIRVLTFSFRTTYETADVYPVMNMLLVTSSEEGGPCTILEAMACGIPVITSNVGHVPEVIEDGMDGFICKSRTVEEYILKIMLLNSYPELQKKISRNAIKKIINERDDSTILNRIDFHKIYLSAIEHFNRRSIAERAVRFASNPYLLARYEARKLLPLLNSFNKQNSGYQCQNTETKQKTIPQNCYQPESHTNAMLYKFIQPSGEPGYKPESRELFHKLYMHEKLYHSLILSSQPFTADRSLMMKELYKKSFKYLADIAVLQEKNISRSKVTNRDKDVCSILKLCAPGRCIEIGAGSGALCKSLAAMGWKAEGIDIINNTAWPEITAETKNNAIFAEIDFTTMEVPDERYDLCILDNTLEHMPQDVYQKVLMKTFRLLKKGGWIIVSIPNPLIGPHDVSRYFKRPGMPADGSHFSERRIRELSADLKNAGFKNLRSVAFGGISVGRFSGWNAFWYYKALIFEWLFETMKLTITGRRLFNLSVPSVLAGQKH